MIMKALLYDNLPKHKLQNKLYSSQISPIWSERLNQITRQYFFLLFANTHKMVLST